MTNELGGGTCFFSKVRFIGIKYSSGVGTTVRASVMCLAVADCNAYCMWHSGVCSVRLRKETGKGQFTHSLVKFSAKNQNEKKQKGGLMPYSSFFRTSASTCFCCEVSSAVVAAKYTLVSYILNKVCFLISDTKMNLSFLNGSSTSRLSRD
jgi:hypothetical protein